MGSVVQKLRQQAHKEGQGAAEEVQPQGEEQGAGLRAQAREHTAGPVPYDIPRVSD